MCEEVAVVEVGSGMWTFVTDAGSTIWIVHANPKLRADREADDVISEQQRGKNRARERVDNEVG